LGGEEWRRILHQINKRESNYLYCAKDFDMRHELSDPSLNVRWLHVRILFQLLMDVSVCCIFGENGLQKRRKPVTIEDLIASGTAHH
jgi:hypothetical protein